MSTFSMDDLAAWLQDTQGYETSRDALHRINGSVAGLNNALQVIDTDSLFWTEPSNLDSLFNQGGQQTQPDGSSDE
jgi:hypothetical protein